MSRKPRENVDAAQLFRRARAFAKSCVALDAAMRDASPPQFELAVPLLVLQGCALELHLKCLHAIVSDGAIPQSLELAAFFDSLAADDRQAIEEQVEREIPGDPALAVLERLGGAAPTFRTLLTGLSHVFATWRSLPETPDTGGLGYALLLRAIRDRILVRRPSMEAETEITVRRPAARRPGP